MKATFFNRLSDHIEGTPEELEAHFHRERGSANSNPVPIKTEKEGVLEVHHARHSFEWLGSNGLPFCFDWVEVTKWTTEGGDLIECVSEELIFDLETETTNE